MPGHNRPTHRECTGKLKNALIAMQEGRRIAIDNDKHFIPDMDELGSDSALDHWKKVQVFLEEIIELGGADLYVGDHPPYKCTSPSFVDVELFAFAWDSPSENRRMYLKFGLRLKREIPTYLYLNCHNDDPGKKFR